MSEITKSKSPFYPNQPVPAEFFVGRERQIDRILKRGAGQTSSGKPTFFFVQGDYGLGKSSFANYTRAAAAIEYGMHGIYASMGGAKSLIDVASAVLEASIAANSFEQTKTELVRGWLSKYIAEVSLFGVAKVNLKALSEDAPKLATANGMLSFFAEMFDRLKSTNTSGIFLVLDEINGITNDPQFSHFIKALADTNATRSPEVPLLLMLCGVEDRRRDMIRCHQPIDRLFDIIDIEPMEMKEAKHFFTRSFDEAKMRVTDSAMTWLVKYSSGLPKIMHIVGDCAYWADKDGVIDEDDAVAAVRDAADEVGKKFVDQQVYKALRSDKYRSILGKVASKLPVQREFTRAEMIMDLPDAERKVFDNFLRKMSDLNVIRKGEGQGEYEFVLVLTKVYIWLQSGADIVNPS